MITYNFRDTLEAHDVIRLEICRNDHTVVLALEWLALDNKFCCTASPDAHATPQLVVGLHLASDALPKMFAHVLKRATGQQKAMNATQRELKIRPCLALRKRG